MANEYYISAGLIPNDEGETSTANTFYISAGLVPDDLEVTGSTLLPILMNENLGKNLFKTGAYI